MVASMWFSRHLLATCTASLEKSIFRNTVKSVQASGAAGGERERRVDKPSTEDTARCRDSRCPQMEDTERF